MFHKDHISNHKTLVKTGQLSKSYIEHHLVVMCDSGVMLIGFIITAFLTLAVVILFYDFEDKAYIKIVRDCDCSNCGWILFLTSYSPFVFQTDPQCTLPGRYC